MSNMRIVKHNGLYMVQCKVPYGLAWAVGAKWMPCVHYNEGPEAVFDTLEEAQRFKTRVEMKQGGGEVVG